jgi:hypothetical protein
VIDIRRERPAADFSSGAHVILFRGQRKTRLGALRRQSFSATEALGLAVLSGRLMFFTAIMPVVPPDPTQQIVLAPDCGLGSWAAAVWRIMGCAEIAAVGENSRQPRAKFLPCHAWIK